MSTLFAEPPRPSAVPSRADGPFVLPLLITAFVALDALSSVIAQRLDASDLDPSGPSAVVESCVVVTAVAATLWRRNRTAVVLSILVAVVTVAVVATGDEVWLVMVTAVTAALRASWRQLGLVVLAHLAYAFGFAAAQESRHPGWGPEVVVTSLSFSAVSFGIGLAGRWFLRARDRRRQEVRAYARENAEIRLLERRRLAGDLQIVLTEGLDAVSTEITASAGATDATVLRTTLSRIEHLAATMLSELQALLEVLRGEPGRETAAIAHDRSRRRWFDTLGARPVRITASLLVAILVALSAARPDPIEWVSVGIQLVGLAACGVAVWRPRWGALGAGLALLGWVVFPTTDLWGLIPVALLAGMGAFRTGPRRVVLVVVALIGYGTLLVARGSVAPDDVVLVGYAGFGGLAIGLAAHHLVLARDQARRQLDELRRQRTTLHADERGAVARELHDVVAYQLSLTSLLVMATSLSDDPAELRQTLLQVERATATAADELTTLTEAMRGPTDEADPRGRLVSPVDHIQTLARRLAEHGYDLVHRIDPEAGALDPTTQRTLVRIIQEAATNILRYAPPGSRCHCTLGVDQTGVRLTVDSPLAAHERTSDLSSGWGLRGIRERVDLSGGTFSAGPNRGRWVLAVTLPSVSGSRPAAAPAGLDGHLGATAEHQGVR